MREDKAGLLWERECGEVVYKSLHALQLIIELVNVPRATTPLFKHFPRESHSPTNQHLQQRPACIIIPHLCTEATLTLIRTDRHAREATSSLCSDVFGARNTANPSQASTRRFSRCIRCFGNQAHVRLDLLGQVCRRNMLHVRTGVGKLLYNRWGWTQGCLVKRVGIDWGWVV